MNPFSFITASWISGRRRYDFLPRGPDRAGTKSASIIYTKHNLSISGPGSLRSSTESDYLHFCHAPHNTTGEGPLWNHDLSHATYTPYTITILKATVDQPTGFEAVFELP